MNPEILHIERDFLVCVKPHGIPSQPDANGSEDMTQILRHMLSEMGERDDIFVVHRLDRATGGVMLYARNSRACAELSQLISDKDRFIKEYSAVALGAPDEPKGTYIDYIYRDGAQKKAFTVKNERKGAKQAILDYRIKSSVEIGDKTFSLLDIRLHTGRFHQIRVQLASRGMPVYGDGKYGSRQKAPHIALWARKLTFTYQDRQYEFEKELGDELPWSLFK